MRTCCHWAMLLVLLTACSSRGASVPRLPPLVTPESNAAAKRALAYLVRVQQPDGSWVATAGYEGNRSGGYSCVMTSLAGLALLAGGNTPIEGDYAPNVRKATDHILKSANANGLIANRLNTLRPMYGHGFSMLFLAQVYGMQADPAEQERIRTVLEGAIDMTVRAQSKEGGWNYRPDQDSDEGSVTVTQMQGLRACRNAGIKVPKSTIDRATVYIENCAQPDGGIAYRIRNKGSLPTITAAAVATMFNAGEYQHPVAVGALRFTVDHLRSNKSDLWKAYRGHSYYGLFYAMQGVWLGGEKPWQELFPAVRDLLVAEQADSGAWEGDRVGVIYGTALAAVVLQIPNHYLPILQR